MAPHGRHLQQALAADHQRACKYLVGNMLGHGLGFTGQHRFVGGQLVRLQQGAVSRDAVALGNHQEVFAYHIAACDAHHGAASQRQRAGAGEVAQGVEGVVGAALLQHRDGHDDHHKAQQDQGLVRVAHCQVDAACAQQQQEHGLAHHVPGHVAQRAALADAQFVGAFFTQALGGNGRVKASLWGLCGHLGACGVLRRSFLYL